MSRRCVRSWLVASLLLAPVAARANLLQNGTFDTSVVPWTGTTFFDPDHDANNDPTSGSDLVSAPAVTCASSLSECVPVAAGSFYQLQGKSHVPPAGGVQSIAYDVIWDSSCGVQTALSTVLASGLALGTWVPTSSNPLVAPPGATAARIGLRVCAHAASDADASFDDINFDLASVVAIPALGRNGLLLLGLMLGAAGLYSVRRLS